MADASPPVQASGSGPLRRLLWSHLRSGHVSRVVYGSIIGLALVLTLKAHPSGPGVVIGTLLASAVAVAMAESYSELVGARVDRVIGGPVRKIGEVVEDAVAVGFGVAFPAVFFLAAALGLVELETAFSLAKWTGLGLIASYGYLAGRLSGAGHLGALLEASLVAVVAGALIVVKALVH